MNAVPIVRNIPDSIGPKPSQAALAWLLGKGDFIVPIPGTKRRKYLEENAGAVDVKLSDDDMARLEAALRPEAVSGRRYNEKLMAWIDRCDLSDRPNQTTGQAHNLKVAGSNPAPATNLCRLDGKLLALRGQHRLTDSEKSLLETQARKYTSPYYSVLRAKIV